MTEEGTKLTPPAPPRIGWYRDRRTGQRRYWNGVAWLALGELVTPFTIEPAPRPLDPPAPAVPEASSPHKGPRRPKPARTKAVLAGGAAVTVAGVVVGALALGGGTAPKPSTQRQHQSSPVTPAFGAGSSTTDIAPTSTLTTALGVAPVGSVPSSTLTTAPHPGAQGTQTVTVVGDSITVLSSSKIQRVLGRNFSPDIHAVIGTTMANWAPFIESAVQSQPSGDWVVDLGTNDTNDNNAAYTPYWNSDFTNEVNMLSGQQCVILVTVSPRISSAAMQLDGAMRQAVATHPNFHLLNWGEIEFENPQWVFPDHIHPTPRGAVELAKLERKALLTQC